MRVYSVVVIHNNATINKKIISTSATLIIFCQNTLFFCAFSTS